VLDISGDPRGVRVRHSAHYNGGIGPTLELKGEHMAVEQELDERAMLTIPEVARILGVGRHGMYLRARRGEVPGLVRIGRFLRVHRPTLEQWIAEHTAPGPQ
jgi:excisionase family DNA binding protein